jgi:hypothetical protein
MVTNKLLATTLWQVSSLGIVDGFDFVAFKNAYSKFSMHVKAKQLYAELSVQRFDLDLALQSLSVA